MSTLTLTREFACAHCSAILPKGTRCDCSPDKPVVHLNPNPVVIRSTTSNAVLFVNNPNQETPDEALVAAVQENLDNPKAPTSKARDALNTLAFSLSPVSISDLMSRVRALENSADKLRAQLEHLTYVDTPQKRALVEQREQVLTDWRDAKAKLRWLKNRETRARNAQNAPAPLQSNPDAIFKRPVAPRVSSETLHSNLTSLSPSREFRVVVESRQFLAIVPLMCDGTDAENRIYLVPKGLDGTLGHYPLNKRSLVKRTISALEMVDMSRPFDDIAPALRHILDNVR